MGVGDGHARREGDPPAEVRNRSSDAVHSINPFNQAINQSMDGFKVLICEIWSGAVCRSHLPATTRAVPGTGSLEVSSLRVGRCSFYLYVLRPTCSTGVVRMLLSINPRAQTGSRECQLIIANVALYRCSPASASYGSQ
eukprot:2734140-Pyramimonas_sp.AAC.1